MMINTSRKLLKVCSIQYALPPLKLKLNTIIQQNDQIHSDPHTQTELADAKNINIALVCVQQRKTRLVRAKDDLGRDDQAPQDVMMEKTLDNNRRLKNKFCGKSPNEQTNRQTEQDSPK
jgi:hypothetical protein